MRPKALGYYAAIERLERFAAQGGDISDLQVRTMHALVMAGGKAVKKATPYRGQNVIRDAGSRRIVYMPPEARRRPPAHGAAPRLAAA